jgi:hypothetical protein
MENREATVKVQTVKSMDLLFCTEEAIVTQQ